MNTKTILYVGIDVSKDKSDICVKDQSGNDLIKRFKITNTKADLGKLYETIERIKSKTQGNIARNQHKNCLTRRGRVAA